MHRGLNGFEEKDRDNENVGFCDEQLKCVGSAVATGARDLRFGESPQALSFASFSSS